MLGSGLGTENTNIQIWTNTVQYMHINNITYKVLLCGITNAVNEIRQVRVETACNMSLSLANRGYIQGIHSPCIPATEAHFKNKRETII